MQIPRLKGGQCKMPDPGRADARQWTIRRGARTVPVHGEQR
jgi:hypothetical protein